MLSPDKQPGRLPKWPGGRNLSDIQFELMIGQEYELLKKIEGRPSITDEEKSATKLPQSEAVFPLSISEIPEPKRTSEKIAEEHGISRATVERSADLFKSHQAIQQAAPEVARKLAIE